MFIGISTSLVFSFLFLPFAVAQAAEKSGSNEITHEMYMRLKSMPGAH